MSRPILFRVRLLRDVRLGGRQHPAGAVVELPAELAHAMWHKCRGALVDPSDLGVLLDAVQLDGRSWVNTR